MRVTRDMVERRIAQRQADEAMHGNYQAMIRQENLNRAHQEGDARAAIRQKMARQRIADQEYEMAERIYNMRHEQEVRQREMAEQDAIAKALHDQQQAEERDAKIRGVMRENDHEYRELKSKLQLALISQTRDNQRREAEMRRQMEEQERLETEEEMMRNYKRREEQQQAEQQAKQMEALANKRFLQEQLRDRERRRQLLEVAEAEREKQEVEALVRRIQEEDRQALIEHRQKQAHARQEMSDFMDARARMREEERRQEEEELAKMRAFSQNVDERLERAKEDQKRREQQRAGLAERLALDVKRKRDEALEYENLCLELAQQQELQRLKDREEAEARKIAQQIEDARRFMIETQRAKAQQQARDREEQMRLQEQINEQQRKFAELAEIEQERNRMRIEKFRRELSRQMVQKKEMYEAARQAELRKLQIEQEREDERQRILNEERRKLVINHILSMGPEAVKYLPKGVLKEDDLNYLPEDYRNAVLSLSSTNTGPVPWTRPYRY